MSIYQRIRRIFIGKPRSLSDNSILHRLALIPVLAWVGLGSDGLSSSAYGPEEAFKTLGEHTYIAVILAVLMMVTILVISACYSKIIEDFPHGGGGYVVASKLLGRKAGVVSGSALLVDYVLTITISIAAAGDAIFSFLPVELQTYKIAFDVTMIATLMILNLRGVKESVLILTPIFILFVITHVVAIFGGIFGHLPELSNTVTSVKEGFSSGSQDLGWPILLLLLIHAYSLGGGTYTGIEAVSNGLPIMREPKVKTAKRTMLYMAVSLAFTASGLLLCYLLWRIEPVAGKTLNAVLFEKMTSGIKFGMTFVILAMLSEGLLLVVAAQAGFIDGPRVLANMANDSWFPRRFSALSDRLTTANGIILMGAAAFAALFYTQGNVSQLVIMYSINVFLTFSLSIFGMLKHYIQQRKTKAHWKRKVLLFGIGFIFCATILTITLLEKFTHGGWLTLLITILLVALCIIIKSHYVKVAHKLRHLHVDMSSFFITKARTQEPLPDTKTAVILVGGYGSLGIQTIKNILTTFPDVYQNLVFATVGVIDSGAFKGDNAIEELKQDTQETLIKYQQLAQKLGLNSKTYSEIGTEIVETGADLCKKIFKDFPNSTFFTGKIIFENESWFHRMLHNETAFSLQKRIQFAGMTMVILPVKIV